MNHNDPLVKGELLGDDFHYHVLDVQRSADDPRHPQPPRRNRAVRPGQQLLTPLAVNAGNDIMVTSQGGDQIAVSKYSGHGRRPETDRLDAGRRRDPRGGRTRRTSPDIVQALQEAKDSGALVSRFEVDALPEAGRAYDRVAEDEAAEGKKDDGKRQLGRASRQGHSRLARPRPVLPEGAGEPLRRGIHDEFRRRLRFQREKQAEEGVLC